ncbi:hypothetical protein TNCV_369961 [Trichonephila clavipes]|nr:hypothetical protein TNCV_369961 [Trichonephila clavipes]
MGPATLNTVGGKESCQKNHKEILQKTSGLNSTKRLIKKDVLENSFMPQNGHEIAVVDFRIATGHDCLSKHRKMIGVVQSPLYKLCDINEEMDTIH